MFFLNSFQAFGTGGGGGGSGDAMEFVIPASAVGSTLTDYVGYIDFADSTIQASSGFLGELIAGAGNIRVYASDKTTEWCRHVNVVSGNTSGQVWFKVPSLSSSADTTFYLYADSGMASDYAVSDTFGRNNTFSPFRAFYGMDTDPSSTSLTDWTGNSNDMTMENIASDIRTNHSNGMTAYDFDGNNDRGYKDSPSWASDNEGAVGMWVDVQNLFGSNQVKTIVGLGGGATGSSPGVISLGKRRTAGYGDADTHFDITHRDESTGGLIGRGMSGAISTGLHHVVFVSDGSNYSIYYDGSSQALTTWSSSGGADGAWFVDVNPTGTARGAIADIYRDGAWAGNNTDDIVGISYHRAAAPSADLISTEHSNQDDPATFYNSISEVTF